MLIVSGIRHSADLIANFFDTVDRSAIVPSDQAEKSGLSSDHVRLNEKYGGGYPANVEGLHHLHCLVSTVFSGDAEGQLISETLESSSAVLVLQL